MKIPPVGVQLLPADEWRARQASVCLCPSVRPSVRLSRHAEIHDEANSRFSKFS